MNLFKIMLQNDFVQKWIAKKFKKIIAEKFGYNPDILIEDFSIKDSDGKVHVHVNTDIVLSSKEFYDILNKI